MQPVAADNPYRHRINRVLDHVQVCLEENLPLERLADVACFSSFHFHRIFKAMMGETVNDFVRRSRFERAAKLMRASPKARVLDIALACGFGSASDFSRGFKKAYGMAPSRWDRRSPLPGSKALADPEPFPRLTDDELQEQELDVELTVFPASRFIYQRVHNAYGNEELVATYHRLIAWLAKNGMDYRRIVMVGMSPDDPEVTPGDKFRYDLGIVFPRAEQDLGLLGRILQRRRSSSLASDGGYPPMPGSESLLEEGFSVREIEASQISALHVDGDLASVDRMWQVLYRRWLPHSRFQPADLPAMEIFAELPEDIGWERFDLYGGILVEELAI